MLKLHKNGCLFFVLKKMWRRHFLCILQILLHICAFPSVWVNNRLQSLKITTTTKNYATLELCDRRTAGQQNIKFAICIFDRPYSEVFFKAVGFGVAIRWFQNWGSVLNYLQLYFFFCWINTHSKNGNI